MKYLVRLFVPFFFHSYFLGNNFEKKESEFYNMLQNHLFNFKM